MDFLIYNNTVGAFQGTVIDSENNPTPPYYLMIDNDHMLKVYNNSGIYKSVKDNKFDKPQYITIQDDGNFVSYYDDTGNGLGWSL